MSVLLQHFFCLHCIYTRQIHENSTSESCEIYQGNRGPAIYAPLCRGMCRRKGLSTEASGHAVHRLLLHQQTKMPISPEQERRSVVCAGFAFSRTRGGGLF